MNAKNKKILLVDDDKMQLTLLGNMLKTEYAIVKKKSGREALKYLYSGSVPHLILLDILMPYMDGWEAFNRIRAICALRDVPIIFLTSLEGTDAEKRGFAMGAADYIMKPVDAKELMERVKNAIEKMESKGEIV